MAAFLKTEQSKKTLDINTLINEIDTLVKDKTILSSTGLPYYGHISPCFEDGEFTTFIIHETRK